MDLTSLDPFIRNNPIIGQHWGGTAPICRVIDGNLQVLEVKNLMIADVSIFPRILDGNTIFPTMVAGKIAVELIEKNLVCNELVINLDQVPIEKFTKINTQVEAESIEVND